MSNLPSKPFSSGTDYSCFKYTYCENCIHYKESENDGFPEIPENGGCRILDLCERARFNLTFFPNKKIRRMEDKKTGEIKSFHFCVDYESNDESKNEIHRNVFKACSEN